MSNEEVFREMENAMVVDADGHDIGKIRDFTFEDFKLKHFVIKGENPLIQGWLGLESRYSLLAHHSQIRRVYKGDVHLSVPVKELKKITEMENNEQRFTPMRSVDVFASSGEDLGKVKDVIFHTDNHFSLILAGSRFSEFLDKVGIGGSGQLFVPFRYVDTFNTNIVKLNKNKDDLTNVLNHIVMNSEGLALRNQQDLSSHEARMELYNESLKDIIRRNMSLQ